MDRIELSPYWTETGLSGRIELVEILVNEVSLKDIAREVETRFAEQEGKPCLAGSYIGLPPEVVFLPSRHLLDEPDPRETFANKPALLGCVGGYVGCWPLVARISMDEDTVTWSDFENPQRGPHSWFEWKHDDIGPFTFDRKQYESELAKRKK